MKSIEIFNTFAAHKCALIRLNEEEMVFTTPKDDIIFFYPSQNKMTLKKVIGRDTMYDIMYNFPMTEINEKEWEIKDINQLNEALRDKLIQLQ
jgi:hypothetical protein